MTIQQIPPPTGDIPSGTALESSKTTSILTLFTPLQIRNLSLQNRFVVSPMGTWSARDGHLTDFHFVHYGSFALRGAALTIIESTAVAANGRTSPQDAGLWKDSQIAPLKHVVDFIHAQGQKAGIQLNYAGRKTTVTTVEEDVWAPSAIRLSGEYVTPTVMTVEQIEDVVRSFADATGRAVRAGVDMIEIHGAHGYLIHQFLSPLINHRTDDYGGSFENRTRFLRRVVQAIRNELPDSIPLSLRISATEWMEWTDQPSWDLNQSIMLAKLLPGLGVDILDVTSGGHPEQRIDIKPSYQIDLAAAIRSALQKDGGKLFIAAVGFITTSEIAKSVVQDGEIFQADLAFVGRQFLREPGFVLKSAHELGVDVQWPFQYKRAQFE